MSTVALAKHQVIFEDVRQRIVAGQLRAGDPLPTQTELMNQYGVALSTVRQALVQLQHEGLVWSRQGKGTFVADRPAAAPEVEVAQATLGLLAVSSTEDPILFDQVPVLSDAAAARDFNLGVRAILPGEEAQAARWIKSQAGVIVAGDCTGAALERLASHGRPLVFIGETRDGVIPPTVGHVWFDVPNVVNTLCDLVLSMGHRRVRLVLQERSAYFDMVSRVFFEAARRAGAQETCDEVFVPTPEDERRIVDQFKSGPVNPTALLVEGDIRACRIIHRLQNAGWPVPQRLSVATIGAAHSQRITVPGLSSVVTAMDRALVKAMEALTTMIDTGRIVNVEVASVLRLGRTCQPIPAPT